MKFDKDNKPEELISESEANEINEKQKNDEKPTFRSRLENFWYFYKWHTIIGGIVLFGVVLALFQFFRTTDPDAYMMYVGPSTLFVKNKEEMARRAEDFLDDYNDDGDKYLYLLEITVAVGEDIPYTAYETNVDARKRFSTEIAAGESLIYLLEESYYLELAKLDVLTPLDEVIDLDLIPDNTYDEYAIRVSELDFFKQDGYSSIPDDTLLCFRHSPEEDSLSYGRTMEFWNSNRTFFRAMFSYRLEEGTERPEFVYNTSKKDASMTYMGEKRIYESTEDRLSDVLGNYLTDFNKDGKVLLGIDYRVLNKAKDGTDYDANADDAAYFEKVISKGMSPICVLERSFHEKLVDGGKAVSLDELLGEGWEDYLVSDDGYGVKIADLDFFKDIKGFDVFDKSLVVCVIAKESGVDDAYYGNCVDFFRKMLTYRSKAEK